MSLESTILQDAFETIHVVEPIPFTFVDVIFGIVAEDAFGKGHQIGSFMGAVRLQFSRLFAYREYCVKKERDSKIRYLLSVITAPEKPAGEAWLCKARL